VTVLVDTSALCAILDRDDAEHQRASATFDQLVDDVALVTHNYVTLETVAIVHRRLGSAAVRLLVDDILPALRTTWVDEGVHAAATAAMLAAEESRISLVDRVSFEVMRRRGIVEAFAFDEDFSKQGFRIVPPL
jgi:predicted nucleic acid-binding protein